MERELVCAPIVSLTSCLHYNLDNKEIVLWGTGGILHWYELGANKSETNSLILLEYGNIQGIVTSFSAAQHIIVFGDKSVAVLQLRPNESNFDLVAFHQRLDDLVLDCRILQVDNHLSQELTLVIGYSHNFYDLVRINVPHQSWTVVERFQCEERVVLFALTLSVPEGGNSEDIVVASGDLFGKLTIWKGDKLKTLPQINHPQLVRINAPYSSKILGTVKGHEGVIFKIIWGKDRKKLITVSDDRTARVWKLSENDNQVTFEPVTVCWGHICRVWDALFIDSQELSIVTCSEDSTIKLWNERGEAVATMKGHLGSVWRIALLKTLPNWILSSSNESSIKAWNLPYHLINSPVKEEASIQSFLIPNWSSSTLPEEETVAEEKVNKEAEDTEEIISIEKKPKKKKSNNSKRNNGVSVVKISPCGRYIVVVLITGQIWLVKLSNIIASSICNISPLTYQAEQWIEVAVVNGIVVTSDFFFYYSHQDQLCSNEIQLTMIHALLNCEAVIISSMIRIDTEGSVSVVPRVALPPLAWKPHEQKAVNVWFERNYSSVALPENRDTLPIVTTSLRGICKLWRYSSTNCDVELQAIFQTERFEIASSFYLKSTSIPETSYYIIGDSRGGVNLFLQNEGRNSVTKLASDAAESIIRCPDFYFNKVHATDPVSGIIGTAKGFITIGHDNSMAFFEEFTKREQLWWRMTNSMLVLPVHTPDFIHITSTGEEDRIASVAHSSIYLGGYHGSSYVVYDLKRNYQLLRIEGGGWKRPHHCQLINSPSSGKVSECDHTPFAMFTCPAPRGKTETELNIIGSAVPSNLQNSAVVPPLHLSHNAFGKVSYCSTLIQSRARKEHSWIAVGGEDCTMKVFSFPEINQLQETTLSKNSSLKALASASFDCEGKDRGIVVGGGGKLLYYIWLYDFEQYEVTSFTPLHKLYVGNVTPNASQDHRILNVNVLFWKYYIKIETLPHPTLLKEDGGKDEVLACDVYQSLILLSDSRGYITLVDFQYYDYEENYQRYYLNDRNWNKKDFVVVQHLLEISSYPMLSTNMLKLPRKETLGENLEFLLVAVGDTRGIVNLLLVPVKGGLSAGEFSCLQDVSNPLVK